VLTRAERACGGTAFNQGAAGAYHAGPGLPLPANRHEAEKTRNFFRFLMPERPRVAWGTLIREWRSGLGRGGQSMHSVECLLHFHPGKRLSAGKALTHPYLAGGALAPPCLAGEDGLGEAGEGWRGAEFTPALQDSNPRGGSPNGKARWTTHSASTARGLLAAPVVLVY